MYQDGRERDRGTAIQIIQNFKNTGALIIRMQAQDIEQIIETFSTPLIYIHDRPRDDIHDVCFHVDGDGDMQTYEDIVDGDIKHYCVYCDDDVTHIVRVYGRLEEDASIL